MVTLHVRLQAPLALILLTSSLGCPPPDVVGDGGVYGATDGGGDGDFEQDNGLWVAVSSGGAHTCGVKVDGRLFCWGDNDEGQLGDGTTVRRFVPTQEGTAANDWRTVSAGLLHTCGVTTDRRLFCWGYNAFGQLGDGTTVTRMVPTQEVTSAADWLSVSAGTVHTCGVKTDGRLLCWGNDQFEQLGNPIFGSVTEPTAEATGATDWVSVSAGQMHSCGVKADGRLFCWGRGSSGQLGGTMQDNRGSPTQETTAASDWASVSAGAYHTCGVKTDGRLFCWGDNDHGQLGDGTTILSALPSQEATLTADWGSVSADSYHTCGAKTDGRVFCWGNNEDGQLGDGTTAGRTVPRQVQPALSTWVNVSTGAVHTCGLKTDGWVFCWGVNFHGELGDGTNEDRMLPTPIASDGSGPQ